MSAPPLPPILPRGVPPKPPTNENEPILVPPSLTPLPGIDPPWKFTPPWWNFRWLNEGAWLINLEAVRPGQNNYDGTMRIENNAAGRTASGDLYERPWFWLPLPLGGWRRISGPPPNPRNGIPIQPRSSYRYYLRITRIPESIFWGGTFEIGFQKWKYTQVSNTDFNFVQEPADSEFTATMKWTQAPDGYPFPSEYAEGDVVLDKTGAVDGRLRMGRVSNFYRKITVEIDNVPGSEIPLDNGIVGAGHEDWATVSERIGFETTVIQSNGDILEPPDGVWSGIKAHETMLAKRDANNLDAEWRYYVLAGKANSWGAYGVMFDVSASDSNNVPREGLQVSSHVIVDSSPGWGTYKGMRYGTIKPAYFRTTLHELGHAFGLRHNDDGGDGEVPIYDFSFMNQTANMIDKSTESNPMTNNIKYNHADRNLYQLRHWPDVFIRPGGVEWGYASNSKPLITPVDRETEYEHPDLLFSVEPLKGHSEIPLGAPVRINLTLKNLGKEPLSVPADMSLKTHHISGAVTDPMGTMRTFRSLFYMDREEEVKVLQPGESITESLTLLRGGQGALFPVSGVHKVTVKFSWTVGEGVPSWIAIGDATVMVTPPLDKSHAAAAHRLLTTPDTHIVLVLGGDYLKDGVDAIKQALEDKTLRDHFTCVEAKRILKQGSADIEEISKLVSEKGIVLSDAEKTKLEKLGVTFN